MPFLPVETWTQIFQELRTLLDEDEGYQDMSPLLSLSITCSFFRPLAQAVLFKDVDLEGNGMAWEYGLRHSVVQFIKPIEARPELGALVRSLTICWTSCTDEPQCINCFNSQVVPMLALLPCLRTLRLRDVFIPVNPFPKLPLLPHLAKIEFKGCVISDYNPRRAVSPPIFRQLAIILSEGPAEAWISIAPTNLESLEIYPRWDGQKYLDDMFSAFTTRGRTCNLTTVIIRTLAENYDCTSLVAFLTAATQIRRLKLGSIPAGLGRHYPSHNIMMSLELLPSEAMAFLEDFEGAATISSIIVPGRPVRTVRLYLNESFPLDIFASLGLSTESITKFKLGNCIPSQEAFLQFAPASMSHIDLSYSDRDDDTILSCASALSRMHCLQVVSFDICWEGHRYDQGDRAAEIVKKFFDACPSIREFDFKFERWLARREGGWERYICPKSLVITCE